MRQLLLVLQLLVALFIPSNETLHAQRLTFGILNYAEDSGPAFSDDIGRILLTIMQDPALFLKSAKEATVICRFTITEEGTIRDIKIVNNVDSALRKEALRILRAFPLICPAIKNGKLISSEYELPIHFSIEKYKDYCKRNQEREEEVRNGNIFIKYERMPEYPGGDGALLKFVRENTHYPESLKGSGIKGRVSCRFLIDKFGFPTDFEVNQGLHRELDQEALRVLHLMPRWSPGAIYKDDFFRYIAKGFSYTAPVTFNPE